jgi:hypothetical protein
VERKPIAAIVPCALALLVLVLLVSAALQKRIHPCVLVGPAIVFASTLPLAGYFYVDADLSAARYLYFPTGVGRC